MLFLSVNLTDLFIIDFNKKSKLKDTNNENP